MKCEIEFLPVGSKSKAGDAIVIRYGSDDAYELMLVDGGHAETGPQIVDHLRQQFGSNVVLQHVLLTHSDTDHASGLRDVLENVPVRNLWLHIPWLLAWESRFLFANKNYTEQGLHNVIKAEYSILAEIVDLAVANGCQVHYPFEGEAIGPFRVCSPRRSTYSYLLPQFDKTPEPDQSAIEAAQMWLEKDSLARKLTELAKAALESWTTETWDQEKLRDGGKTNASNESSVVLFGSFENNNCVLLTGDVGINGLHWAANYIESIGQPLQQFTFVQIPHHGSRRNVGPTILTRLLGSPRPQGLSPTFNAFVSAPADDSAHPRRIVLNAFARRGADILATQGGKKVHWGGFAARPGYGPTPSIPFYNQVEDYT
jgi:beta-lactamase superfamily II metal-dependent hydrolase